MRQPFLPTARQTNWLLIVGLLAIGYAFYLRYLIVEHQTVALGCLAGLPTWQCAIRRVVVALFGHSAFGWFALAAAVLHLIRPSLVLFALALAAAGFGIVLYNTELSALAAALLILSFARPRTSAA